MKKVIFLFLAVVVLSACSTKDVNYLLNLQPDDVIKEIRQNFRPTEGKHYCGELAGYNNLKVYYSTGGEEFIKLKEGDFSDLQKDEYGWCDDMERGGVSFVIKAPENAILFKIVGDFTVDIPKNENGAAAIYYYENGDINYGQYTQYENDLEEGYFTMEATYHVPIGRKTPDSIGFVYGVPYKYQFSWY